MVTTNTGNGILDKEGVIAYVGQNAAQYGLDPAAVLAVANHEGLNTAPGSTWILPKEGGFNFGPPSWYSLGAGSGPIGIAGSNAPNWAWTPQGLDYWLTSVSKAASGLTGTAAISAIVNGFEHPREDLAAGEIQNASHDYQSFQTQIANLVGGVTDATTGVTQPAQTGDQTTATTTANPTTTGGSNPTQPGVQNLNFTDTIQHSIVQFLLVMVGLVLLIGGIYLLGSKR